MSKFRLIPYAAMTAVGLLAVSGAANAQSMYNINQRQDSQQNRIEQGVRSGQLTRSEAQRLGQGERAIDQAQRRAAADGRMTSDERARLDRMTDRQGREIYQQGHDRQQSWDRGQGWGRTDGRAHNGWNDRDGRGGDNRGGWNHRDADRRDWGRGHNNGSWNQGRDHNGWNHGGNNGSNGHNGGWNHNGNRGNEAGTSPGTGRTGHTWNGGGWNRGGQTGGAAVANNTGMRSWGGQTRPASSTTTVAPTRSHATANTGARSGGGRSFGGGGRR